MADTMTAKAQPGSEAQQKIPRGFQDADDVLPPYHIEAQTSLVERPLRSLKFGEAFGVLDSYGDIGVQPGPEGLYFQDTRYLSRLELTVEGQRPSAADLTGAAICIVGALVILVFALRVR